MVRNYVLFLKTARATLTDRVISTKAKDHGGPKPRERAGGVIRVAMMNALMIT